MSDDEVKKYYEIAVQKSNQITAKEKQNPTQTDSSDYPESGIVNAYFPSIISQPKQPTVIQATNESTDERTVGEKTSPASNYLVNEQGEPEGQSPSKKLKSNQNKDENNKGGGVLPPTPY